MKTSNLQEQKTIYIPEGNYSTDNEISLIDLTMVLVKRKTMIAVIFILITALSITVTLFTPKTYTFSTTIDIGSQIIDNTIIPFETPQALVPKLHYSFIPQILSEHRQSYPDDNTKYRVRSSVPSGGNIVLLEIEGTENQTDTLKKLLQTTSQKAIKDHSRIFQSVKNNLEARINQATNNLKSLEKSNNNGTEIAMTQNTIELLSSQLENLRNTREIMPPIRSSDPTSGSRKIIVIFSSFAGIFLGIFAAFFTEFVSKVQQRIDEEDKA